MPKVSVIIPSHNNEALILDTVQSVFAQNFTDYEVIVVDGSTDNTRGALSKYNSHIRYFYQEPRGVSAARNLGIGEAKGEYIAFLDADDMWLPDYLKITTTILEEKKDVDLVYTNLEVRHGACVLGVKPSKPAQELIDFWQGSLIVTSSVILRKACLQNIELFDENLKIAEDIDLWIRLLNQGVKVHFVPQILAVYRLDNEQSLTKDLINVAKNSLVLQKKLLKDTNLNVPLNLRKQKLAKSYYALGKLYYQEKRYSDASEEVMRAVNAFPLVGLNYIEEADTVMTRVIKVIKPYVVLCYLLLLTAFQKVKTCQKSA